MMGRPYPCCSALLLALTAVAYSVSSAGQTAVSESTNSELAAAAREITASCEPGKAKFDTIAFEGGGVRGAVFGGAAIGLDEAGLLDHVENVAGTSAGSMAAAFLSVGYTACELQHELSEFNFVELITDVEVRLAVVTQILPACLDRSA